ncbi:MULTISPECIES: ATP-grasp domain-containing protein [unclassified Streptomyces]|uniref:ATP-grasp domain-containing protein n=1 Tax=unclassified Streptomyces TaxID=2593676 RepID=UPI0037F165D1
MTTVLVIGGAAPKESGFVRDICERAMDQFLARNVTVILTDTKENLAAAPELVGRAAASHELDFADAAACRDWATAFNRHTPVDAVVGFREYAVVSVAEVASALGLAGNPPEAVRRVRTKDECREFLREHGLRQPELTLCATEREALEFLAAHGPEVVVKPRRGSSSEGVRKVSDPTAMATAFVEALDAEGLVLVEEFVHGTEFSVEGIFEAGVPNVLAVTRKHLAAEGFVEIGHVMPAPLPGAVEGEVRATVIRALGILGLGRGHFHVECWVTDSGVVLGEVHARQPGDWLHAMLEWIHPGLELYGRWLDDLLSVPAATALPLRPARGAAARFLAPPPGVVQAVHGWDELSAHPSLLASSCALSPGSTVQPVRSNLERSAAVVVGTEDAVTAESLAARLLAGLRIDFRV